MEKTAVLLNENISNYCPITNHYWCSDDRFLLVMVPSLDVGGTLELFGVRMPMAVSDLPTKVDVFLADGDELVLDADGDLANGMTPLASFEVATHEDALALLGYTLAT